MLYLLQHKNINKYLISEFLSKIFRVEKRSLSFVFGYWSRNTERIGKFYHFYCYNFVNFFAILTLDFTPCSVVKLFCYQKLPFFTNFE